MFSLLQRPSAMVFLLLASKFSKLCLKPEKYFPAEKGDGRVASGAILLSLVQ